LTAFHNGHRFSLILSSIGQVITVEIDRSIVRKLTDKELVMSV